MRNRIAREISYAGSAETRGGRTLIRLLENATGRIGLIRRAQGYEREVAAGRCFWQVMADRYGLGLEVTGGALSDIPSDGPLVLVANHPFGILDGLMMGLILRRVRGDFRILAHQVFCRATDLGELILPVRFDATKEAIEQNLETRSEALRYLGAGGAVGVFPGGTVSTAATPLARPMDPQWRLFTARMIAKSGATVVPIYFEGANSRLFQLASHLHMTLRLALLIREFRARTDQPVRVVIGRPLDRRDLDARANDPKAMMDFLRKATYDLSPTPLDPLERGLEFEERYRT